MRIMISKTNFFEFCNYAVSSNVRLKKTYSQYASKLRRQFQRLVEMNASAKVQEGVSRASPPSQIAMNPHQYSKPTGI